jgi:GDP-mannose 6-dehydrogenase
MSRTISVFGMGYVGTVTAACLASKGNCVVGVDANAAKVEAIHSGHSPVVEPGLAELISKARAAGLLSATSDAETAVLASDISFLCVGTPSLRNGKLDLGHIERVCHEIGVAMAKKSRPHLVVLRSTALPGTAETLIVPALEKASGKQFGAGFGVCVNPEFMREATAVADFLDPAITVIGAAHAEHSHAVRAVYEWVPGRVFETTLRSAEMLKYSCNAWHAVKVAFANEMGTLAKALAVDAEAVTDMFLADTRLNVSSSYLRPGFAFGGSCLPKDLRAIAYRAREADLRLPLLESVQPSNDAHLERAAHMILETGKKRVGMLGLSFKAGTDDLRESPHVQLVKRLLGEGRQVRVWDEQVSIGRLIGSNRQYIEEAIPHIGSLLSKSLAEAVADADIVVIGSRIPGDDLRRHLRPEQLVIDFVNLDHASRPTHAKHYEGICW